MFSMILRGDPSLTLVDIGSSGGVAGHWRKIRNLTVVEFEPDERAANPPRDWPARRVLLRTPLWEKPGEMDFHLTVKQQTSSLFRPNDAVFQRYPRPERVGVQEIRRVKVDTLTNQLRVAGVERVDFIKLDAQGAELAILRGAEDLLRSCVVGLEIEVEFLPLYHDQPLFADVDTYVRSMGFELFELRPTQWSYLDGNGAETRGQLAFGDALYFRSLESLNVNLPGGEQRISALAALARLYGREDFARYLARRAEDMPLNINAAWDR